MKFHKLSLALVSACAATVAFAGGPDQPYQQAPWKMDLTLLGGVAYTAAHAKNHTLGNPGPYTQISLDGTGGEVVAQVGVAHKRISFGFLFDENAANINGGNNLAGQSQKIDGLQSWGGYLGYKFLEYNRSSMSLIGTLAATSWNIKLNESQRNNNSINVNRTGVSEGIGLRYQYLLCRNLGLLGQMNTTFHQINTQVFSSNEDFNLDGNSAVTTSFLLGLNYQFAL